MICSATDLLIMETLLLSILKPQVRRYSMIDLGPSIFQVKERAVHRSDHCQQNVPFSFYQVLEDAPIVLYIHSYNSNRLEPLTLLSLLIQHDFNVATIELQRVQYNQQLQKIVIDPQGIVSFGHYQCQQVVPVVRWLRERSKGKLFLWGRSMGAVTSLLYQSKYCGADGLILDSPFHSLHEIFLSQLIALTNIPRVLGKGVLFVADRTFQNLLHFSINQLDILERLNIHCPAFIIVNPTDALAGPSCNLIYSKLKGTKRIIFSQAEHSGSRESHLLTQIIKQISLTRKPKRFFRAKSIQKVTDVVQITEKTQQNEHPRVKKKVYLKLMQVRSAKVLKIAKQQ